MCTVVVDFDPTAPVPVLLAGVRDEFHDRPWVGPGRHWPDRPGLVGGRDLLAGGTWLAAAPEIPRVACVLNGRGPLAEGPGRLSRGELPLRFAETGSLAGLEYDRYDPFHLVCAGLDDVRIASWNGAVPTVQVLGPGVHIVVNSGLEGRDPTEGPGTAEMNARLGYFRPRLLAATRPDPEAAGAGPAADTVTAWDGWLPLVDGDGLAPSDERALVLRRTFGDGRVWGTSSVTLVGLRRAGGLRYDFNGTPGDPRAWSVVED